MKLTFRLKGGAGSGHRGHAGIPGHQGGSLPGAGVSSRGGSVQGAWKKFEPSDENQVWMRDLTKAATIDRAIAPLLKTLNEHGIETGESCSGHVTPGSEESAFPFIAMEDEDTVMHLADLLEQHKDKLNYDWSLGSRHGGPPSEKYVIEPPMSINPTAKSPSRVTREVADKLAYDYNAIQDIVRDNFEPTGKKIRIGKSIAQTRAAKKVKVQPVSFGKRFSAGDVIEMSHYAEKVKVRITGYDKKSGTYVGIRTDTSERIVVRPTHRIFGKRG